MHVKWNRNLDGIRRSNSPTNSSSSSMTATSSNSSSTDSDDLQFADADDSSMILNGNGTGGCGGTHDTKSMNLNLKKNYSRLTPQDDLTILSSPVNDLAAAAIAHPRPASKDDNNNTDNGDGDSDERRGLHNHQNSVVILHNHPNAPMDVQYQTNNKSVISNCTAMNTKLNSVTTSPNGQPQQISQSFKSRKRDNFGLKMTTSSRRQLIANHLRQQSALLSFRSSSPMSRQQQSAAAGAANVNSISNRITSKHHGALATLIGLFKFRDSVDDLNTGAKQSHARQFRRRLSLERLTSSGGNSSASSQPVGNGSCRQTGNLLERHPVSTSLRYRQRSNSLLMLQDIALSPEFNPQSPPLAPISIQKTSSSSANTNHNSSPSLTPECLSELVAPPLPPKPAPPVVLESNLNTTTNESIDTSVQKSNCDNNSDDNNSDNNLIIDDRPISNIAINQRQHSMPTSHFDNLENCENQLINHSANLANSNGRNLSQLSPAIITATALITETPRKSLVKFINDEPSYTVLDHGCRSFFDSTKSGTSFSQGPTKPLQGILRVRNYYSDSIASDSLRSSSASSSLSSNSSGSFSSGGTTSTTNKRVRFARPLLTYAIFDGS